MTKQKRYLHAIKGYFAGISRMRYPLITLVALVISDGLITQFLVIRGLGWEGNPFLQTFVGERSFLIIKVAAALTCAIILWDIYKVRPKMAWISTWCLVAAYSGIVGWNFSVFFNAQV